MESMKDKKVLLSLKNVEVKFNVRGRILTAIRNVSLDVYENESLAIVGESGSGKSVLTKTFAGMLETNGFISNGSIILADDEISQTTVKMTPAKYRQVKRFNDMLNNYSVLERGAKEYNEYLEKTREIQAAQSLSQDEEADYASRKKKLSDDIVDRNNYLQTLDPKSEEDAPEIEKTNARIKEMTEQKKALEREQEELVKTRKAAYEADSKRREADQKRLEELKRLREEKIAKPDKEGNPNGLSDEVIARNERIAYELLLSIDRYPLRSKIKFIPKLNKAFKTAMCIGEDLSSSEVLNKIFEVAAFRVEFRSLDKEKQELNGYAIIDCAKVKYTNDWQRIRGRRIATVFQDPMTSLNPVITIGKQIMTVILKHQQCSAEEAKKRTIDIMGKVGIPEPEKRFNDYPFEYSGGMRQRIVIAIALSCQPKILICDEPTTALDVTIQAQILHLIKQLKDKYELTTIYITHDLGVVANVADRIAVMYAGDIVEIGTTDEVFYDPKHPYTWALLSSLPQLGVKGEDLYSIKGTPPNLFHPIRGDAFAARNPHALKIDFEHRPPYFEVSPTHKARTWLLDPRAPHVEPPESIKNIRNIRNMRNTGGKKND